MPRIKGTALRLGEMLYVFLWPLILGILLGPLVNATMVLLTCLLSKKMHVKQCKTAMFTIAQTVYPQEKKSALYLCMYAPFPIRVPEPSPHTGGIFISVAS